MVRRELGPTNLELHASVRVFWAVRVGVRGGKESCSHMYGVLSTGCYVQDVSMGFPMLLEAMQRSLCIVGGLPSCCGPSLAIL